MTISPACVLRVLCGELFLSQRPQDVGAPKYRLSTRPQRGLLLKVDLVGLAAAGLQIAL
jgi:hypothetical protein